MRRKARRRSARSARRSGRDVDVAVSMQSVIADIEAETAALRELIAPLPEGPHGWDTPTPAIGWTIRDQISHLAFFDDVAVGRPWVRVDARLPQRRAAAHTARAGDGAPAHRALRTAEPARPQRGGARLAR